MGVTEISDARDVCLSLASQETVSAVSQVRSPNRGDPLSEVLGRRLSWLRVERGWRKQGAAIRQYPLTTKSMEVAPDG
jgi:hypothetical protein